MQIFTLYYDYLLLFCTMTITMFIRSRIFQKDNYVSSLALKFTRNSGQVSASLPGFHFLSKLTEEGSQEKQNN